LKQHHIQQRQTKNQGLMIQLQVLRVTVVAVCLLIRQVAKKELVTVTL